MDGTPEQVLYRLEGETPVTLIGPTSTSISVTGRDNPERGIRGFQLKDHKSP